LLWLFQHLQRASIALRRFNQAVGLHRRRAARYEFDFNVSIRNRVQDPACQFDLDSITHYPGGWYNIEVDYRRRVEAGSDSPGGDSAAVRSRDHEMVQQASCLSPEGHFDVTSSE
jgi:hypothetical protein